MPLGRTITDEARKALKPYTDAMLVFYSDIQDKTDEELIALERAANEPNSVNCWFVEYEAAQVLKGVVLGEMRQRARARAEERRAEEARPETA